MTMTPAQIAASRRNGKLGGRPRGSYKPLSCSCQRSDGTHMAKCRITEALRKRAKREAEINTLDKP